MTDVQLEARAEDLAALQRTLAPLELYKNSWREAGLARLWPNS